MIITCIHPDNESTEMTELLKEIQEGKVLVNPYRGATECVLTRNIADMVHASLRQEGCA